MTEPPPLPPGFDSAEHFLSAIVDSSDDAIITKNLNGIITSWNKSAQRMFGYEPHEIIGKPVTTLIPHNRQDEEPKILDRLRRGERVDHFDTKRLHKDGHEMDISLTISPVRNRKGEIVGASKIARHIGDQKRAALAVEAANEEVSRQNRMKDEFIMTLSHELRTPLQSIVGWVQILEAGNLEEGEFEKGIQVIKRNAQAQQHIIEDLLDMNRILSGKVRLDVQKIMLGAVLEAAIDSVKPSAQAKDIRVHAVLDPLSTPVLGDPQRLQQVLWNLLTNAVKFTPNRGRIEVLMQRVNSHVEISIQDSGMGISSEFLPYVFDRFRQGDASTTRNHSGLGLGLAIVKHLMELHGGTVAAKSMGLDRGATFTIALPMVAVSDNVHDSRPSPQTNGRSVPQLTGIKVLVVDDDEDSRDMVAMTLRKAGAIVRSAAGADAAMSLIDEVLPQVIVSDIGMPEKNGFTFVEELRARPLSRGGKIPAAALTAYTRVEDRVQALCAGFQILLPKPVDGAELIAAVAGLAKQAQPA